MQINDISIIMIIFKYRTGGGIDRRISPIISP